MVQWDIMVSMKSGFARGHKTGEGWFALLTLKAQKFIFLCKHICPKHSGFEDITTRLLTLPLGVQVMPCPG